MKRSLITISIVIISITLCVFLKISLFYGFLTSIIILFFQSKNKKNSISSSLIGLKQCKSLYIIILLLGANISIWMSSAIIPTVIYFGFDKIRDVNFLFFAFISTAILSSVMGTGLGTLSTVGIALLGIGKGFGIPEEILLGAIISGAFISDKISPVSALTNLTIEITDIKYSNYFKSCIKTLLPTIIITSILYFLIGSSHSITIDDSLLTGYQNTLLNNYKLSPFLFLIPIGIILMALFKVNVISNMIIVFLTGSVVTIFYQNTSIGNLIEYILFGYKSNTGDLFIDNILKAGGIIPMLEVLLIVSAAIVLNALLMSNKILDPLFSILLKNTNTKFSLILKTGLISSMLTTLTCDQTVGIVVPGEILKKDYKRLNIKKEILARTISDTGTIIAPLEFWNVNSLIIIGVTGISALRYAPYAFLCFIAPIVTLIGAYISSTKQINK